MDKMTREKMLKSMLQKYAKDGHIGNFSPEQLGLVQAGKLYNKGKRTLNVSKLSELLAAETAEVAAVKKKKKQRVRGKRRKKLQRRRSFRPKLRL